MGGRETLSDVRASGTGITHGSEALKRVLMAFEDKFGSFGMSGREKKPQNCKQTASVNPAECSDVHVESLLEG